MEFDRPPRVLLVDDHPSVISSMQRNLRPYRLELHIAFHGFQGVSTALACSPDLVITDLQMPLASGEELLQCLSHIPKTRAVPIIVLTGRPRVTLSKRLRAMGVQAVLHKPAPFSEVLDAIAGIVPVQKLASHCEPINHKAENIGERK
jgi:CheY-like chemotaxis protein